jgi:hypothetical protein
MKASELIGKKITLIEIANIFQLDDEFEAEEFLSDNFLEICKCGSIRQELTCVESENKPCSACVK